MTEAELLKDILGECRAKGLLAYHSGDSRRDIGEGFPDLVICGVSGIILRELKGEDGETSAAQDLWAWTLTRAWHANAKRGEPLWGVWRPADWASGRICAEMEAIR